METAASTRPATDRADGVTRIVVGVDGSETARRAAVRAGIIAESLDAHLHVVLCASPSGSADIHIGGDRFHTDWVQEARAALDDTVRSLQGGKVTSSVGDGDPARSLCDEAEAIGAELIIVGNKRAQGAARLLGSVASAVTKRATCDVMVVHTAA